MRMLSRAEKSGLNPAPSSSSETTRPWPTTRPSVGRTTRAMILSSVDLPAPFGPRMPRIVPAGTAKDTLRSAHSSRPSLGRAGKPEARQRHAREPQVQRRPRLGRRPLRRDDIPLPEAFDDHAVHRNRLYRPPFRQGGRANSQLPTPNLLTLAPTPKSTPPRRFVPIGGSARKRSTELGASAPRLRDVGSGQASELGVESMHLALTGLGHDRNVAHPELLRPPRAVLAVPGDRPVEPLLEGDPRTSTRAAAAALLASAVCRNTCPGRSPT